MSVQPRVRRPASPVVIRDAHQPHFSRVLVDDRLSGFTCVFHADEFEAIVTAQGFTMKLSALDSAGSPSTSNRSKLRVSLKRGDGVAGQINCRLFCEDRLVEEKSVLSNGQVEFNLPDQLGGKDLELSLIF